MCVCVLIMNAFFPLYLYIYIYMSLHVLGNYRSKKKTRNL